MNRIAVVPAREEGEIMAEVQNQASTRPHAALGIVVCDAERSA